MDVCFSPFNSLSVSLSLCAHSLVGIVAVCFFFVRCVVFICSSAYPLPCFPYSKHKHRLMRFFLCSCLIRSPLIVFGDADALLFFSLYSHHPSHFFFHHQRCCFFLSPSCSCICVCFAVGFYPSSSLYSYPCSNTNVPFDQHSSNPKTYSSKIFLLSVIFSCFFFR